MLLTALAGGCLRAGEAAPVLPAEVRDATSLVAEASRISRTPWLVESALQGKPTLVGLARNVPGSLRQAVAFTLDCWWSRDTDNGLRLGCDPTLPLGPVMVRVIPSQVEDQRWEPLVRTLVAPWLSGLAAVAQHPGDGTWAATLDDPGHRQLITILTLLERPLAQIPALVPDPDQTNLGLPLAEPPVGATWTILAQDVIRCTGQGVAIRDPDHLPPPKIAGRPTTLGDLPRALQGVQAAWIHGVLCIQAAHPADAGPDDTAHPAAIRQFACLPIGHLLDESPGVTADILTEALRRRTGPARWVRPGYALMPFAQERMLLAAGDVPLLHAVQDAMGRIDGVGYPAWLAEAPLR